MSWRYILCCTLLLYLFDTEFVHSFNFEYKYKHKKLNPFKCLYIGVMEYKEIEIYFYLLRIMCFKYNLFFSIFFNTNNMLNVFSTAFKYNFDSQKYILAYGYILIFGIQINCGVIY